MSKGKPKRDLPDFGGWSNEEVGAFIKGLTYLEDGGDVQEIIEAEDKRSLLGVVEKDNGAASVGGVATMGPPTRSDYISQSASLADEKFRKAFGGHARAIAAQLSRDVHPFLAEAIEKLQASEISYQELNILLSKMVIVAAASTIMAVETVGFKK